MSIASFYNDNKRIRDPSHSDILLQLRIIDVDKYLVPDRSASLSHFAFTAGVQKAPPRDLPVFKNFEQTAWSIALPTPYTHDTLVWQA